MAKGTYRLADSPDDPIYNGRFVISSPKSKRPSAAEKDLSTGSADSESFQSLTTGSQHGAKKSRKRRRD